MSTVTSKRAKQRISAAKFAHRTVAYELVTRRWQAGGLQCEGCGTVVDLVERHHAFGRGHLLADQWASRAEMMVALCCARSYGLARSGCHEAITTEADPALRDRVRFLAIGRLCAAEGVPVRLIGSDPIGSVHAMEDWLDARARGLPQS